MRNWYPLLLLLLLAAVPALAQTTTYRLGVRGGLNRAGTSLAPDASTAPSDGRLRGHSTSSSFVTAWQAGAVLEIRRGRFALQPGLLFSQTGQDFTYTAYDSPVNSRFQDVGTARYSWVELPLNATVTLFGDHGPQVLAGPYVAFAVGGRRTGTRSYTNSTSAYRAGNYSEAVGYGPGSYSRRFEAGLRAGVGYRQGPVQLQFLYSLGLTSLHQGSTSPDVLFYPGTNDTYPWYTAYYDYQAAAAHSQVWQLTGTYFFDL